MNARARGTTNCPDAQAVVKEGLCIFRGGRIYMADDTELPRTAPNKSMARAIRSISHARRAGSAPQGRNIPTCTPQVTFAEMVGPAYEEYMSDGMSDIGEAHQALWQNVFMADRPQPTSHCYNPISKDNRHACGKKDKDQELNFPKAQPYVELPCSQALGNAKSSRSSSTAEPSRFSKRRSRESSSIAQANRRDATSFSMNFEALRAWTTCRQPSLRSKEVSWPTGLLRPEEVRLRFARRPTHTEPRTRKDHREKPTSEQIHYQHA
jgi:hypothetical protein